MAKESRSDTSNGRGHAVVQSEAAPGREKESLSLPESPARTEQKGTGRARAERGAGAGKESRRKKIKRGISHAGFSKRSNLQRDPEWQVRGFFSKLGLV